MTLENFNYRTNPLFLRNQFISDNEYGIPNVPTSNFSENDLADLKLLAYNLVERDKGKHSERIVHFFLYDYNFEKLWTKPDTNLESLSKYKGVLTPDFSLYLEMPYALQIYNVFRNRWCGAYLADKGLKVIPTVSWSDERSFDFCFAGIEKGSVVAVSTYMFHEHNNHADQKDIFMKGYNKMLEVIEPKKIICYSEPFAEMRGNIIYVDYELSSWKHLNDEQKSKNYFRKQTNSALTSDEKGDIIYKMGFVCSKGGGSAHGGPWQPKKPNDERFLGPPNTTQQNHVNTKNDGYNVSDKYDGDGKAIVERHFTDHNRGDLHSNPHDHEINWDKGHSELGPPINYDGNGAPKFKRYILRGDIMVQNNYNPDDYKFETLGEFKLYLSRGANVGFEYNGVEYGIEGHNNSFDIWIYDKGDIANNLTLEQTLDYELDGVRIRDLILDAEITERLFS